MRSSSWERTRIDAEAACRNGPLAMVWGAGIMTLPDGAVSAASATTSLQQEEKTQARPYDIAVQLAENRSEALKEIEKCANGNGDLTQWLSFYLDLYLVAVRSAYAIAEKNQFADFFWKSASAFDLNSRQRRILNLMLDEKCEMTNREYVEICKTSRESAKRDLAELVTLGLLKTGEKKGRSVNYRL